MGNFIRRHPFWFFYVLAVGIATLVWTYILAAEMAMTGAEPEGFSLFAHFYKTQAGIVEAHPILHHHSDSVLLYIATYIVVPIAVAGFFFPFAPTIAALCTVTAGWGRRGLLALLSAYRPIRGTLTKQEGVRIYATLFAFIGLATSVTILRVFLEGDTVRVEAFLHHIGVIDWRYFLSAWLIASFFNQGALLEELGWRGYALPLLIRKLGSPLGATLLLGVAWTFWHFPREIPTLLTGQQDIVDLVTGQMWFLLFCCSGSIIMTYFVNITGGSILPAIIVHGMFNFIGGMLASAERVGARSAFSAEAPLTWAILALIVILLVGKDLGWKRRLELHGGDGASDPSLIWSRPVAKDA